MDPELEAYVDPAADPRFISGIYNYCHRRCERCPFTARCLVSRDLREYEARHPDAGVFEQVHDSFQKAFALLEAWCEREGIDFEAFRRVVNSEESFAEIERVGEAIDRDPLHQLARTYARAGERFPRAMEFVRPGFDEPEIAAGALSTLACFEPRPR